MVFHNRPIRFAHVALSKQLVHAREPLACARKHHQPTGWAVDAVRHSAEHVAWLLVFLFNPSLQRFHQWLIACAVALHDLAASLVYYNEVIVFVNYFH